MSSTFLSVFLSNCGQAGNPFDQTFLPPSMASFSTFFVALVAIYISPIEHLANETFASDT